MVLVNMQFGESEEAFQKVFMMMMEAQKMQMMKEEMMREEMKSQEALFFGRRADNRNVGMPGNGDFLCNMEF